MATLTYDLAAVKKRMLHSTMLDQPRDRYGSCLSDSPPNQITCLSQPIGHPGGPKHPPVSVPRDPQPFIVMFEVKLQPIDQLVCMAIADDLIADREKRVQELPPVGELHHAI